MKNISKKNSYINMGNTCKKSNVYEIEDEKFKNFSLKDLHTQCKILSVYDGDTCTIGFIWKNMPYRTKVRMLGYDSPEMKPPKAQENRDKEIEAAKRAKQFLIDNTKDKVLYVDFGEFDKYGRPLATLYVHEKTNKWCISCIVQENIININELMVQKGHGYRYDGGTKKTFK